MASWHDIYLNNRDFGEKIADQITCFIGSWQFIIIQTCIFIVWVIFNTLWLTRWMQFDPYPFILFNLFMSAEAAYASPLILMSQNRQSEKDRMMAEQDYLTDCETRNRIEQLQAELSRIETTKLDPLIKAVISPSPTSGPSVDGSIAQR